MPLIYRIASQASSATAPNSIASAYRPTMPVWSRRACAPSQPVTPASPLTARAIATLRPRRLEAEQHDGAHGTQALGGASASGSRFVGELYRAGGFAAIDAAWANPPQSTEHILHPERYRAGDAPQIVALAPLTDTLGVGWQEIENNVMGEFFLREYLDQQLPATGLVDHAHEGLLKWSKGGNRAMTCAARRHSRAPAWRQRR